MKIKEDFLYIFFWLKKYFLFFVEKTQIGIFLFVALMPLKSKANSSIFAKISQIKNGAEVSLDWENTVSPVWEKNLEGGLEFFWIINLTVPNSPDILSIQTDDATIDYKRKDSNEIPFKLVSMKNNFIIQYKNGKKIQFKIELSILKPILTDGTCEKYFLTISNLSSKKSPYIQDKIFEQAQVNHSNIPGYLAYKCEKTENGILLAITVPSETSWISNNIFEIKGKGQRWKNFELNFQTPIGKDNVIGEFIFENNNKHYSYFAITEKTLPRKTNSRVRISLGVSNISISSQKGSLEEVNSAANVAFRFHPFHQRVSFGGNVLTILPLYSNSFLSYSETIGYIGFTFSENANMFFEPRLYSFTSEGISQNINFFYKLSGPAVGGSIHYLFKSDAWLEGELVFMQHEQGAVSSFRIYFDRRTPLEVTNSSDLFANWGVVFIFEKIDMTTSKNHINSTSQIYVGPSLNF